MFFGVEMKWIVTCKDHFTGYTGFFPIPAKEARYVVHTLEQFFALIGYPKVFHTDNGTEFTAKSILEFLKSHNPNIVSVTGRPRTPSDQGSVENMNKFGKTVLQALENAEREAGRDVNWVNLLPRVTVAVNSHKGKGSKCSSAYEAVFGLKYHDGLPGSLEELKDITTINEYLEVFPDSDMRRLANQFILDGDVQKKDDGEKKNETPKDEHDEDTKDPADDIDFSVIDRMNKFGPTKYGDEFHFAFPNSQVHM